MRPTLATIITKMEAAKMQPRPAVPSAMEELR
jgi:hypothetical protein